MIQTSPSPGGTGARARRNWRKLGMAAICGSAIVSFASNAAIAAPRTHDGFYLEGALGPALLLSRNSAQSGNAPGSVGLVEKRRGLGLGSSVLLGGTLARKWVLGGGYVYNAAFSANRTSGGVATRNEFLDLSTFGPFVDFFPMARSGLHFRVMAGVSGTSIPEADDVADSRSRGLSVSAAVGYEFWVAPEWSIGALAHAGYTRIGSGSLWSPALLATFTYH